MDRCVFPVWWAQRRGQTSFTSSSQAADDMAAPNQPTDNTTMSDPLMDVAPHLFESTDVTTTEHQLTDVEMITDSRSVKASGEGTYRDFSLLPLVVWLKIFLCLNQRDRLALSVTCRSLYEVCRDSSVLWRSVFVDMKDDDRDEIVRLKTTDRSVLRAHCHQIQKLVIQMMCYETAPMEESSSHVFSEVAEKSQLKHLEINNIIQSDIFFGLQHRRRLHFIHTFITSPNTSQLCQLKIQDFDSSTHGNSKVVETLNNSSFISSLTHLYLELLSDCSREICQAVKRFQNLQSLTVSFNCLSNSLLDNFPQHLKEVHFIVHRSDRSKHGTNWPQVLSGRPQLKLGLIFVGMPSYMSSEIISSIQSYLPISFIRCEDMYSVCDYVPFTFHKIVLTSCAHLKVLQCWYNEILGTPDYQCLHHRPLGRLESRLINIVSKCPSLDHLEFSGNICRENVLVLATLRKWSVLEFCAASISNYRSHPEKEKKLQTLCADVSMILGRNWKLRPRPVSTDRRPSVLTSATRTF